MCGRYTLHKRVEELAARYNVAQFPHELRNNYNVAPGQQMPIITADESGKPQLELMQWGLIPFWAKDPRIGYKLINARDDTVFEKPMWRNVILKKRCLVPADGFYEWQRQTVNSKVQKQPFYIHPKQIVLDSRDIPGSPGPSRPAINGFSAVDASTDTPPSDKTVSVSAKNKPGQAEVSRESSIFSFAGVWETWKDNTGTEHKTYSIITTEPNKEMAAVHNRMPVILHPEDEPKWLEPSRVTRSSIEPLLRPFEDNGLEIYRVSSDVNSPSHNNESLVYPLGNQ